VTSNRGSMAEIVDGAARQVDLARSEGDPAVDDAALPFTWEACTAAMFSVVTRTDTESAPR
jgi:hypothetical protein